MVESSFLRVVFAVSLGSGVADGLRDWFGLANHWALTAGLAAGLAAWISCRVYTVNRTLSDGEG